MGHSILNSGTTSFFNQLCSYFKNLLGRYKEIIISPVAKKANSPKSYVFIYLKLLDSIAKKLRPIIFKDLYVVANPSIVNMLERSTIIPKDFIFIAREPKIPIIGSDKKMLTII